MISPLKIYPDSLPYRIHLQCSSKPTVNFLQNVKEIYPYAKSTYSEDRPRPKDFLNYVSGQFVFFGKVIFLHIKLHQYHIPKFFHLKKYINIYVITQLNNLKTVYFEIQMKNEILFYFHKIGSKYFTIISSCSLIIVLSLNIRQI